MPLFTERVEYKCLLPSTQVKNKAITNNTTWINVGYNYVFLEYWETVTSLTAVQT